MQCTLIFTSEGETSNNNKFYKLKLDGEKVIAEWGRVGQGSQSQTYSGGQNMFDKKKREKLGKGYTEVKVVDNIPTSSASNSKVDLKELARKQIKGSYGDLIDRLVEYNVHNILSGTTLSYNSTTGLFSTPLGVVTSDTITEARKVLDKLYEYLTKDPKPYTIEEANKLTSQYLRLIPKNLGMNKPILANVFRVEKNIQDEFGILDSLEQSVQLASVKTPTDSTPEEQIWDVEINQILDKKIIEYITEKFESTKKAMHTTAKYKVKSVYSLRIQTCHEKYSKCPVQTNKMELWHGTGVANILSILRAGLKISPPNTAAIAGKMFGNGVYFATSSSKSLGYSSGFWRSGDGKGGCFMFLASVNVGREYHPNRAMDCKSYIDYKTYDAVFARPKDTGLANDEIICFREDQYDLQYLIEFET
jgi:poly [ADP-ribose] polymerase